MQGPAPSPTFVDSRGRLSLQKKQLFLTYGQLSPFFAGTGVQPVLAPTPACCYLVPVPEVLVHETNSPNRAAQQVDLRACEKKPGHNIFLVFRARLPSPAPTGQKSGKAAAGGPLRALEKANLPEGNVLEIVFNYLTNYSDYYKVKTHTKSFPLSGLNLLNFLRK